MSKKLNSKQSQNLFYQTKKSATEVATDGPKTISKRAIQKTAAATVDLTTNIIADTITKFLRNSSQSSSETVKSETQIPKNWYIYTSDSRLL